MDYDEYDEEAQIDAEAEETIVQQFDEKLTFEVPISYNLEPYIKKAVEQSVEHAVGVTIQKLVDEKFKKQLEQQLAKAIEALAVTAFSTPVKEYDYAGNVKSERSLEDLVRDQMMEVQKQGLSYKLQYGSYSSDRATIQDIIKADIYKAIQANLKPQFEAMEKEFKEKSQAALREFAIQAVDSATAKVLGAGR